MRGALTCAQAVNSYLEFLTLRAIYEVYIGNTTFQADIVKDDFDNINKPANATDLQQRLSEVPSQGIEALVRPQQGPCGPPTENSMCGSHVADLKHALLPKMSGAFVASTEVVYTQARQVMHLLWVGARSSSLSSTGFELGVACCSYAMHASAQQDLHGIGRVLQILLCLDVSALHTKTQSGVWGTAICIASCCKSLKLFAAQLTCMSWGC